MSLFTRDTPFAYRTVRPYPYRHPGRPTPPGQCSMPTSVILSGGLATASSGGDTSVGAACRIRYYFRPSGDHVRGHSMIDTATATVRELEGIVGGLSKPSKMPGYSYGLPAEDCSVGGRLRDVEGSVCAGYTDERGRRRGGCYAYRGAYAWPGVKEAYTRRLAALQHPQWVPAMAELLNRRAERNPHFRWHDSGDIQSLEHLERIVQVCELTPSVSHWIPTREYRIVNEYLAKHGSFPDNLCVRLSAPMIGGHRPTFPRIRHEITTSTVALEDEPDSHNCPARHQGNECGDCRACWNRDVPNVSYHLH